jgi:hypothetical protein
MPTSPSRVFLNILRLPINKSTPCSKSLTITGPIASLLFHLGWVKPYTVFYASRHLLSDGMKFLPTLSVVDGQYTLVNNCMVIWLELALTRSIKIRSDWILAPGQISYLSTCTTNWHRIHPIHWLKLKTLPSHVCYRIKSPSVSLHLGSTDRRLAKKCLAENRKGAALRLLANVSAYGDKIVNACGSGRSY